VVRLLIVLKAHGDRLYLRKTARRNTPWPTEAVLFCVAAKGGKGEISGKGEERAALSF